MIIKKVLIEAYETPDGHRHETLQEARLILFKESLVAFLQDVLKVEKYDRHSNDIRNFVNLALYQVENKKISLNRLDLIFSGFDMKSMLNVEVAEPENKPS